LNLKKHLLLISEEKGINFNQIQGFT